jgi:hypothetical protein
VELTDRIIPSPGFTVMVEASAATINEYFSLLRYLGGAMNQP